MYRGERFNGFSHLAGAILAAAGMAVLVTSSALHHDAWKVVSSVVYGTTLVLLYTISTLYHSLRGPAKSLFQRLDYCAIYLLIAGSYTRKPVLIVGIIAAILSGFTMAPLLGSGQTPLVALFLIIELFLMGVTFAPMGALLPELFPTNVRYTGAGVSYNLGGILGASIAPYIAQKLAQQGGLSWVGMYVSAAAVVSLIGVLCMRETRIPG